VTRTHPGPERARLQTYPCRRFGDTFFVIKFSRLLCTAQKFVLFLFVNPKNPSRRRTATPTTPRRLTLFHVPSLPFPKPPD
jgi:hypothetical protein